MLGDQLKLMREQRSWSQAHLADAAGLNIRTVQRIEAGEPYSYETALALAAALDCNVAELEPERQIVRARFHSSSARMALAAIGVMPLALFLAVNLLRSVAGISTPYSLLAAAGPRVMTFGYVQRHLSAYLLGRRCSHAGNLLARSCSVSREVRCWDDQARCDRVASTLASRVSSSRRSNEHRHVADVRGA